MVRGLVASVVLVGLVGGVPRAFAAEQEQVGPSSAVSVEVPAGHPVDAELGSFRHDERSARLDVWGDERSLYVEVQSDERVRIRLDTVEGTTVAGLVGRAAVTGESYLQLVRNGDLVCESAAAVTLDELVVDEGEVSSLALEVEADCGGSQPVVARVDFDEAARRAPAPPAPDLWRPVTVPSGSHLVIDSDEGDFVGRGYSRTYTTATSAFNVEQNGTALHVLVDGPQWWSLSFSHLGDRLVSGFHGPVDQSEMNISSQSRGCVSSAVGRFSIDRLEMTAGGQIAVLEARFEQRCHPDGPRLRGVVRFDHRDVLTVGNPRPVAGPRWAPDPASLPGSTTFVHLDGAPGSWVFDGRRQTFTEQDRDISVRLERYTQDLRPERRIVVELEPRSGAETGRLAGTFVLPRGLTSPVAGHYGRLDREPFHSPIFGGLDWSSPGRGCNQITGWYAIDAIEVVGDELESLALRFEQRCFSNLRGELSPPLRGEIRWRSDAPRPARRSVPAPRRVTFPDVTGGPHQVAVETLAGRGVLNGFADGRFGPAHPVTRAQLASILVRALQIGADAAPSRFSDVGRADTHAAAIATAASLGIVQGYGDGSFRPQQPVTRAQVASMINRALDLPYLMDDPFSDLRGSVHRDAIATLTWAGVVTGYADGTYRPNQHVTRGQVASLVGRTIEQLD